MFVFKSDSIDLALYELNVGLRLIMFLLLFLFIYVISPITSSVVADRDNKCSGNEFTCRDGACIDLSSLCDGRQNCDDGSDEAVCDGRTSDLNFAWNTVSSRARRQATCQKNQWQCRDGTCIGFDGKCDGVVDCPDGSDETHPLCRSSRCQSNWFRCTYGACVDGSAPCNGIKECADNSDELLPRCRNNTDVVAGQFKCENGEMISSASLCDGVTDCSDGSDETVRACAGNTCYSYLFQCAYGACVDQGSDCNGKQECADGSDESPELCNKSGVDVKPLPSDNNNNNSNNTPRPSTPQVGNCILPEYPENGQWVAPNERFASPGKSYKQIYLQYSCNIGYQLQGAVDVTCIDGQFIQEIPKCVRLCHLNRHASIDYYCYSANGVDGRRPCNDYEPQGTIARPQCKVNYYYYYGGDPQPMTCSAGGWSDYPICSPECGRVTPQGDTLIINGQKAKKGELPWHAGIYKKTTTPYMQICGGSIVRPDVILSAAHCFWDDDTGKQPARNYAVGVGKLYRAWNDKGDKNPQKADVKSIEIPETFQGITSSYAQDIAVVKLSLSFTYEPHIAPVCLDFDESFDNREITRKGAKGKVAGWGLIAEDGNPSPTLQVVELPIIPYGDCNVLAPEDFRRYLTYDKICAGYIDKGTAVCHGDSGGGLVLPALERSIERYYLRGVVSTSPRSEDHSCNSRTLSTFTRILSHASFIKRFI
ncbi:modular serine protease-like [Galleria mellonella]|uniref:Modular serine protease-like n=1 Tax=Galleria mellonella TaxID=7137 RepID=A0A6J1WFH8_GALME|nr:modular serine protease-like [Galleria mellonella]